MTVRLVSDEKVAETSSKGNQEKWFDPAEGNWYKLDQFGYEALAETFVSLMLEKSNIDAEGLFSFTRYNMEKLHVHGRERTGCVSRNFLQPGQSLITVNRLLSNHLGIPLKQKLVQFPSDKKRIDFLAKATAEYTGLADFPRYLTLLFEVDALICNDDRHLNNIALIEHADGFKYCPIFDNGAALLSNTQISRMDIAPKALLSVLLARPFNTSFNRQMNTARKLFGSQLKMPALRRDEIRELLQPLLSYYAERDRGIIAERVAQCVLLRQKAVLT